MLCHHLRAITPCRQQNEDQRAHGQWEPAALLQLGEVGGEKANLQHRKTGQRKQRQLAPAVLTQIHHKAHQHGGNQHGARHRNTVGRCQCA